MMKNKILGLISVFIVIIFSIVFVNAQIESLGTVRLNQCISLKQSCGNCTYSNITAITYPNKTTINVSYVMTKQDTMYYYTFCDNNQQGEFIVDGKSDVNGVVKAWAYDYTVQTGSPWIWITLIVIAFLFLFGSFIVDEEIILYLSGIFFLITGIYVMINGLDLMNIKDLYVKTVAYAFIGIGLLFTVGAYTFNRFNGDSDRYDDE